ASAGTLAEDLQRFLAGEPILARPVGPFERAWRWCRRNPAVAAISAVCLLLLVGSLIGMTALYLNAEAHRAHAESARGTAETARGQAETARRLAEGERKRADEERDAARNAAEEVKRQQKATEFQRLAAREEADRARQVTRFLVGMFDA